MMHLIFLFALAMSHGFLLQTNSPLNSGTVGNQQYITKAELYDTQNQLQTEVNFVRNDMNKKLDLLTSQLQQMLSPIQQQITGQRCHNDTKAFESLGLKYYEVMGNYTKLEDKFDSLQIKYSKQEIELQSVRNETKQLKDEIVNLNSMKNKQDIELRSEINKTKELEGEILNLISLKNKQDSELLLVKNKTKELEDEIVNLNSLKSINQLTDLRLLQQEVQSISAQTHSFAVNEQARIQDFLGLYNSFKEHEVNEGDVIQGLNSTLYQQIQRSEISTNVLMSNVYNKMEELKKSFNVTFLGIQQQISKNSEKVALTACAEISQYMSSPRPIGYIIKYGDIRTQVNINNLFSFRSSGKFTCEKEGLYLVSAWDLSKVADSAFSIHKNGNLITNAYITGSSVNWSTATAVVVLELLANDTVWVQVISPMDVHPDQKSCLTIVKVK